MKIKIAALIVLGFIPNVAFGDFTEAIPLRGTFALTEITNEITTEANTGGNSAGSGETIIKGNAEASIEVKTEINGEEIQNIEIQIESDGEIKELIKEENKTSEDGETEIKTKVELRVASIVEIVFEKIKKILSWFI